MPDPTPRPLEGTTTGGTTTVMRRSAQDYRPTALVDFRPRVLGDNPVATQRILGLVQAGHSYRHIAEIGHYQGAWSREYLDACLAANRVTPTGGVPQEPQEPTPPTIGRPLPVNAYERQVLGKVCSAWLNPEIAAYLGVPETRIKSTVRALVTRSKSRDRLDLVVGVLTGLLNPVDEADHDA